MTIITLVPYALMLSAIDWEKLVIMIKGSRYPCIFAVTGSAVCSKTGGYMRWIGCVVIVILMATYTGIGGVVVITIVTKSAFV